jgi:hypothetical protein
MLVAQATKQHFLKPLKIYPSQIHAVRQRHNIEQLRHPDHTYDGGAGMP